MSIKLDDKMLQARLDAMDMPSIAESGKAIVRLYLLDALQGICDWSNDNPCDSSEEARY